MSIFLWQGELQANNPREQNGSYSLFSILGSNCNLIILGGFITRFALYLCFSNTQEVPSYLGIGICIYIIQGGCTIRVCLAYLHLVTSGKQVIVQEGHSYRAALPRACAHLWPWHT